MGGKRVWRDLKRLLDGRHPLFQLRGREIVIREEEIVHRMLRTATAALHEGICPRSHFRQMRVGELGPCINGEQYRRSGHDGQNGGAYRSTFQCGFAVPYLRSKSHRRASGGFNELLSEHGIVLFSEAKVSLEFHDLLFEPLHALP